MNNIFIDCLISCLSAFLGVILYRILKDRKNAKASKGDEKKTVIFYSCDHQNKKCKNSGACGGACNLTEDITHAKNFNKFDYGDHVFYIEKVKNNSEVTKNEN